MSSNRDQHRKQFDRVSQNAERYKPDDVVTLKSIEKKLNTISELSAEQKNKIIENINLAGANVETLRAANALVDSLAVMIEAEKKYQVYTGKMDVKEIQQVVTDYNKQAKNKKDEGQLEEHLDIMMNSSDLMKENVGKLKSSLVEMLTDTNKLVPESGYFWRIRSTIDSTSNLLNVLQRDVDPIQKSRDFKQAMDDLSQRTHFLSLEAESLKTTIQEKLLAVGFKVAGASLCTAAVAGMVVSAVVMAGMAFTFTASPIPSGIIGMGAYGTFLACASAWKSMADRTSEGLDPLRKVNDVSDAVQKMKVSGYQKEDEDRSIVDRMHDFAKKVAEIGDKAKTVVEKISEHKSGLDQANAPTIRGASR